jgi:hypothetical protein
MNEIHKMLSEIKQLAKLSNEHDAEALPQMSSTALRSLCAEADAIRLNLRRELQAITTCLMLINKRCKHINAELIGRGEARPTTSSAPE